MALAASIERYLIKNGANYKVMVHAPTDSSLKTAQAVHVPGDRLAKTVILKDEQGYVMAVLPATHRLELGMLHQLLDRELGLATEKELQSLFFDCELGAIPPFGSVYGMEAIVDDELMNEPEIYFEGGDHCEVVRMDRTQFARLLKNARHGRFSRHM